MFIEKAYASGTVTSAESQNSSTQSAASQTLPPTPGPIQSGWSSMVPMVLIFAVFYFLLIRPQERRRREQQNILSTVKKGEEVLTNSGIFGIVTKINDADGAMWIEIAKDVEIKVLKTAISDITSRPKEVHKKLPAKSNAGKNISKTQSEKTLDKKAYVENKDNASTEPKEKNKEV